MIMKNLKGLGNGRNLKMRVQFLVLLQKMIEKNYLPYKQEKATKTVLEQAELLCLDWAA